MGQLRLSEVKELGQGQAAAAEWQVGISQGQGQETLHGGMKVPKCWLPSKTGLRRRSSAFFFFFGGGQWGEVEVGELLTAFSGWKMYEAGELSTMITLLSSRPRRLRSFT